MKPFSLHQYRLISLMLFSMFFGAGNLIFPPLVGKQSAEHLPLTMAAFGVTAVVLPVLAIVAVSRFDGLYNLAGMVNRKFALFFTIVIYMSIGPFLGIPRAGSTPFEMAIAPYLPESVPHTPALLLYTLVFFSLAFWISLSPGKLTERVGKVLTPSLLVLLLLLFAGSFVRPLGGMGEAAARYQQNTFLAGFVDGYQTMDAVAALNFGLVITTVIRSFDIQEEAQIKGITLKAGIVAGSLLMFIYLMLSYLGSTSGAQYPETENGAQILTVVSRHIFGDFGAWLLALIFTLACLTTCVGLLTSISQYFYELTGKLGYRGWLLLWTLISTVLANFGLNGILKYSIPVLVAIYPVATILILFAIFDRFLYHSRIIYNACVWCAIVFSSIDALKLLGVKLPVLTEAAGRLPYAAEGLGWSLPTALVFVVSYLLVRFV